MASRSNKANSIREASHAGSWYSSSPRELSEDLDAWLDAVNPPINAIGPQSEGSSVSNLPVQSARIIVAPHAGYSYSGPAAAWAYKSWDVSKAKRVFLLGPSHHYYTSKAALSQCAQYATPLGDLQVDRETTNELFGSKQFEWMSQAVDEAEHSLEMHLPYIFKTLSRTFGSDKANLPPLVPIMIGNTSVNTERNIARVLAPYLADPTTAWVISSDFAHWGLRFNYTYYRPADSQPIELRRSAQSPKSPPIHESIRAVDFECMGACESGSHEGWTQCLESNGNTVCGRHPIAVMLATIQELRSSGKVSADAGFFRFIRYERSSEVRKVSESSVSYASAFAVL